VFCFSKSRINENGGKMSQFIAQMLQAGAVTEYAATLLSFRYLSFTGKPEQNIN